MGDQVEAGIKNAAALLEASERYDKLPEDVWAKTPQGWWIDEELKHSFGDLTVTFGLMPDTFYDPPKTIINCYRGFNGIASQFDVEGNFDAAKNLVDDTIKYCDQKQNVAMTDIWERLTRLTQSYNYSQKMEEEMGANGKYF